ncbi:MAG: sulfite exporter TauE/SafE family protein [Laribacter sp.]|nr:sulfite exporter TauE/SafE family protein [Laribacter sp.]MBP9527135.1 sulfite exporter TauE/SafE family protein [Laribacter sp.]MBP9609899.1 sulfite exporter TauE/SafE family protein [Laribacter sp.]
MPEYSLVTLFLVGLMGGGHCLGMCGGLVTALSLQLPPARSRAPFVLAYNLGRVASYVLVGAIVGGLGGLGLAALGIRGAQLGLFVLAQCLMILLGLYLAGFSGAVTRIEALGRPVWRHVQPVMKRLLPVRSPLGALGVGMLWGWLPCGLVYSASLTAMASGSAAGGATGMLAFALGTLPNLLAMGAFAEGLRGWLTRLWVRRMAGMAVVAMALWQLWPVLGQWSQALA